MLGTVSAVPHEQELFQPTVRGIRMARGSSPQPPALVALEPEIESG